MTRVGLNFIMRSFVFLALASLAVSTLAGCQQEPIEFPPTPTAITWPTPLPTSTPFVLPTPVWPTPLPTPTPITFPTPLPTATPAPTATAAPTPTPQSIDSSSLADQAPNWPTPLPTATPQPTPTPVPVLLPPTFAIDDILDDGSRIKVDYFPSSTWGGKTWEFYQFELWRWNERDLGWELRVTKTDTGPPVIFLESWRGSLYRVRGRACTIDLKLCGFWGTTGFHVT